MMRFLWTVAVQFAMTSLLLESRRLSDGCLHTMRRNWWWGAEHICMPTESQPKLRSLAKNIQSATLLPPKYRADSHRPFGHRVKVNQLRAIKLNCARLSGCETLSKRISVQNVFSTDWTHHLASFHPFSAALIGARLQTFLDTSSSSSGGIPRRSQASLESVSPACPGSKRWEQLDW